MQRVSWPPSCSLTSTTSIRDPSWARPTRRLQGWPCQHVPKTRWPGTVQTRPRTSRLLQLPILAHQARPDHLKSAKDRKKLPKAVKPPKTKAAPECPSGETINMDHHMDHQLIPLNPPQIDCSIWRATSKGEEGINIGLPYGSPTDTVPKPSEAKDRYPGSTGSTGTPCCTWEKLENSGDSEKLTKSPST